MTARWVIVRIILDSVPNSKQTYGTVQSATGTTFEQHKIHPTWDHPYQQRLCYNMYCPTCDHCNVITITASQSPTKNYIQL